MKKVFKTKKKITKTQSNIFSKCSKYLKITFTILFSIFFISLLSLFGFDYLNKNFFDKADKIIKKENNLSSKINQISHKKTSRSSKPIAVKEVKGATPPKYFYIPQLKDKRTEQTIQHSGYTVSYNSSYRIANWVAYELTSSEATNKKNERSNKFVPDPAVKGATAYNEDYTRTGFDRGHLAPAGDMKWSAKAMRESFYLSNVCPQHPGLNRGLWRELEEQCRLWAQENGKIWIATGPIVTSKVRFLGKHRVAVPSAFFKVIAYYKNQHYKGIGFIFENKDYPSDKLEKYALPIDQVEKITGIDFFPLLEDREEQLMESKIDWDYWSF